MDFSVFKNFSIKERAKVQFRAEFFNLLNTPAFSNPNATLPAPNAAGNLVATSGTTFGNITSTKHDNRQIQFALKFFSFNRIICPKSSSTAGSYSLEAERWP